MAAPLGNQNGAKAKQWTAAIERALERRGDPSIDPDVPLERSPRAKAMDALADIFLARLEKGETGDAGLGFFKEFGDRLEGKATQQTDLNVKAEGMAEILGSIKPSPGDGNPVA